MIRSQANNRSAGRLPAKCIKKFLYYFPGGYQGKKYLAWERDYKWNAHLDWEARLNETIFLDLLGSKSYSEIAKRALSVESKTNLLFSFEKMALRDGVKSPASAQQFSIGLFNYIYGDSPMMQRFEQFRDVLAALPVKQTRVLTWPLQTVFGFIARPDVHMYLKPTVTRAAAVKYGFGFDYSSKVNWHTYKNLIDFAEVVREDTKKWKPRDMIDLQSFIWVVGSEEYPD
jgi:hypothetical protein